MMRFFSETLLVGMIQFIGLSMTLSANSMPVWMASGTAMAFIFMRGYFILPGLWLGTFAACWPALTFLESMQLSFLLCGQTFCIFYLTQRFVYPSLYFYKKTHFVEFLLLTLVISFPFSQPMHHLIESINWLSNVNGILIVGMSFIALDACFPQLDQWNNIQWGELKFMIVLGVLFLLSFIFDISIYLGFTFVPPVATTLFTLSCLSLLFVIKQ